MVIQKSKLKILTYFEERERGGSGGRGEEGVVGGERREGEGLIDFQLKLFPKQLPVLQTYGLEEEQSEELNQQ